MTAIPAWAASVLIDVDLSHQRVTVTKAARRPISIYEQMLPVTAGSVTPAKYRVWFSRKSGVENALVFGSGQTIRTSAHFEAMRAAGRPIAGSIVLPPEFGGLLYRAVVKAGVGHVLLKIH